VLTSGYSCLGLAAHDARGRAANRQCGVETISDKSLEDLSARGVSARLIHSTRTCTICPRIQVQVYLLRGGLNLSCIQSWQLPGSGCSAIMLVKLFMILYNGLMDVARRPRPLELTAVTVASRHEGVPRYCCMEHTQGPGHIVSHRGDAAAPRHRPPLRP
jgi:hypothetical protein